jgi:hypothetical protein
MLLFLRRSRWLGRLVLPFVAFVSLAHAESPHRYRPALIGNGPRSLVNLIDGRNLVSKGQGDGLVMFEATIAPTSSGPVEVIWCHATPESKLLKAEVQNALRNASFIPALVDGKPVEVVFYGTVIFMVRDGRPYVHVFANQDREALAEQTDFVEPQLLVGTDDFVDAKPYLEVVRHHTRVGHARLIITVDANGRLREALVLREEPTGLNIAAAALKTYSTEKFIPGFRNGSPVTCTVEREWAVRGYRRF